MESPTDKVTDFYRRNIHSGRPHLYFCKTTRSGTNYKTMTRLKLKKQNYEFWTCHRFIICTRTGYFTKVKIWSPTINMEGPTENVTDFRVISAQNLHRSPLGGNSPADTPTLRKSTSLPIAAHPTTKDFWITRKRTIHRSYCRDPTVGAYGESYG